MGPARRFLKRSGGVSLANSDAVVTRCRRLKPAARIPPFLFLPTRIFLVKCSGLPMACSPATLGRKPRGSQRGLKDGLGLMATPWSKRRTTGLPRANTGPFHA
jgi:hypothetical protein